MKKIIIILEKGLSQFISELVSSLVSLLRICILSSIKVAIRSKKYEDLKDSDTCIVLGNGPSLKHVLDNGDINKADGDMMCVNMFCKSNYFSILRPKFYMLCDGGYFHPTSERVTRLVEELIAALNSVDWKLYLIIPPRESSNCYLLSSIHNNNITVLRMNHTEVSGFKCFRHFMYKTRIGMPRCQTVVNYALVTAINMKYHTILLYGADHSWSKDTWVGDDNRVYTGDPHLYANNTNVVCLKHGISEEFLYISQVFSTHRIIREYADYRKVRIINKTKGSFIDAYDRN